MELFSRFVKKIPLEVIAGDYDWVMINHDWFCLLMKRSIVALTDVNTVASGARRFTGFSA